MSAIIQASPLDKLSQAPLPGRDSCVLIIFGASGDLTKRKLIPGLYNLASEGCMNPEFEVLGIGWRIITPIEEAWAQLPPPDFPNYAAGSEGPTPWNELLEVRGSTTKHLLGKTD